MSMKVDSRITRRTAQEHINTPMDLYTKEIGRMVSNMERELKHAQMEQLLLGYIQKDSKMAMGNLYGKMDPPIKENLKTTTWKATESTNGLTVAYT